MLAALPDSFSRTGRYRQIGASAQKTVGILSEVDVSGPSAVYLSSGWLFFAITNDADIAVGLEPAMFDLRQSRRRLVDEVELQLVERQEMPRQILPQHGPVLNEKNTSGLRECGEPGKSVGHPVKPKVPAANRRNKNHTVRNPVIFAGHGILCGVGDEHDNENVR